jgi:hypothetical protein
MGGYRNCCAVFAILVTTALSSTFADDPMPVTVGVERQPFVAATRRLVEAMEFAGAPLSDDVRKKIDEASSLPDDVAAVKQLQLILDPLCLAFVNINAESRVKVAEGPVKKELMQQGWRAFLIKVHNEAGINPVLIAESPNALPVYQQGPWSTRGTSKGSEARQSRRRVGSFSGSQYASTRTAEGETVRVAGGVPRVAALQPRRRSA